MFLVSLVAVATFYKKLELNCTIVILSLISLMLLYNLLGSKAKRMKLKLLSISHHMTVLEAYIRVWELFYLQMPPGLMLEPKDNNTVMFRWEEIPKDIMERQLFFDCVKNLCNTVVVELPIQDRCSFALYKENNENDIYLILKLIKHGRRI